jgi:hypothetical protein
MPPSATASSAAPAVSCTQSKRKDFESPYFEPTRKRVLLWEEFRYNPTKTTGSG